MASATTSAAPAATSYSTDPALYIYTSLTAGSSHIVTATSRLETILRANRVPFKAIDIATDEKARMLWGRRAGKDASGRVRKLPGLVQMGMVLGDLVEIEDWNEYGELKQHVTIYYDDFTQPTKAQAAAMPQPLRRGPVKPAATAKPAAKPTATAVPPAPPMPEKKEKAPEQEGQKSIVDTVKDAAAQVTLPIRGIAEEAAAKAKDMRLQSLREKVYGKGGKPAEEGRVEEKEDTTTESKTEEKDATLESKEKKDQGDTLVQKPAPIAIPSPSGRKSITSESPVSLLQGTGGMQSPTTGAWKHGPSTDDFLRMLQSPTSTSWKPTDVDEPIKCYRGSLVQTVSEEEIEAIEKAEMIEEDPEAEEEAEEEDEEEKEHKDVDDEEEQDDEDDDEEEDESEEDAKTEKKPAEVKPDEKK